MSRLKKLGHRAARAGGYLLMNAEYMPLGIELGRDIARTESLDSFQILFDVGANVGHMSEVFSEQFPAAMIHAFEPISSTFDQLQARVAGVGRITCHRLAMSSRAGTIEVHRQEDSGLNSLNPAVNRPDARMPGMSEMVSVVTVDDFCREHRIERIDLLKTDAEGMDLAILEGAEGMIRGGKVRCVLSECGLNPGNSRNTPFHDLAAFLFERNFRLKAFYDQSDFGRKPFMTCANALFMLQDPRPRNA